MARLLPYALISSTGARKNRTKLSTLVNLQHLFYCAMSSDPIEQLSCELAELEKLRQQAQLPNVRKAMDELIEKQKMLLQVQNKPKNDVEKTISASNEPMLTSGKTDVRPTKKLITYAFDESDKFVKLYYSVPGVTDSPGTISTDFRENSFSVHCSNINGIDYEIRVQGLCQDIEPEKSIVKQKSGDQLLVMLKKTREQQNWGSLLKLEKDVGKNKVPKMDKDGDPQEGLMNMMKQMLGTRRRAKRVVALTSKRVMI
uniref:CS domain-containing protein n=1 Tax=Globodera rostochiensis TaxID=31243 RepID=A0A914HGR1_GLORO